VEKNIEVAELPGFFKIFHIQYLDFVLLLSLLRLPPSPFVSRYLDSIRLYIVQLSIDGD